LENKDAVNAITAINDDNEMSSQGGEATGAAASGSSEGLWLGLSLVPESLGSVFAFAANRQESTRSDRIEIDDHREIIGIRTLC
jgi:hypothetical protein